MTNFATRVRLIYVPFLLVSLGFILIYTFLNWIFVINLEIPLNEELVHFWLPCGLVWIPLLIWLRPRIKLLVLKDKKGNLPFLYHFAVGAAIIAPTIIAQTYLTTASGKLTVLHNISEISNGPLTKYYELKHYNVDKRHIAVYRRSETSGRNNENLDFYIDVACPILIDTLKPDTSLHIKTGNGKNPLIIINGFLVNADFLPTEIKPADIKSIAVLKGQSAISIYGAKAADGVVIITTKTPLKDIVEEYLPTHVPKAWLCLEFRKSISNHLSEETKEKEYKEFDTVSDNEFKEKNLNDFIYLDRLGINERRNGYVKAIKERIPAIGKPIVLEAVNEPFEARNGDKLEWIFMSFGIGAVIWLIMIVIPKFDSSTLEKLSDNELKSSWNNIRNALISFKGKGNFQVTIVIIGLNILVFIIMVFAGLGVISFDARDLLSWGANYRPATVNGQWWRLLTSIFLHGGLMHLLLNMYGLFFVAIFLEPQLGRIRYASAYLICGVAASLASIWWYPATISIGASGAIFGLYGVFVALLTTNKANVSNKKSMLLFSLFFIIINLVIGLMGGIDNAAHIGGLLCGLLLGYIFYFFTDLPETKEEHSEIEKEN